jgi:hypothetical protein
LHRRYSAAGTGSGVSLAEIAEKLGMKLDVISRVGVANMALVEDALNKLGMQFSKFDGAAHKTFDALNIDSTLLKLVNQGGVLVCLVRQAVAVFDINFSKTSVEKLDADFEAFPALKGKKKVLQGPETTIVGGHTVQVVAGQPDKSSLSGIAKAQYGDFNLWPLIYDLNKDRIGNNPNRIHPGTKLLLLPLERYTQAELADARKRAPTWKNYPH